MTKNLIRTGLVLAIAGGAFLLAGGTASAAPGDALPGDPPLTLPAQPDSIYPQFSRCYDLEPAGDLPRRACYRYTSATGELIEGSGQTFIYPAANTLVVPAVVNGQPTFPTPVGPSDPDPAPNTAPSRPATPAQQAPGPVTPLAHATPSPEVLAAGPTTTANGDPIATRESDAAGCVPDAVRGMPGFDVNLDPDHDGVSCESPATSVPQAEDSTDTDGLVPMDKAVAIGLAAAAALVLFAVIGLPLLRRGRHRAEG